jgi:hypothetical protein
VATPYAGNPASYPASVNLPDGGDAPSAALFKTAYEGCLDRTAFLNRLVQTVNWQDTSSLIPVLSQLHAAAWDTRDRMWIVAGTDPAVSPGHLVLMKGRGDPAGWSQLGPTTNGTSVPANSVASSSCRGAGSTTDQKYVYVGCASEGSPALHIPIVNVLDTTASTWAGATVVSIGDALDVQVQAIFGGSGAVVVAALGATATGHGNIYYSTDHGVTWTVQASFSTASVAITRWLLAQTAPGASSGSVLMAMPGLTGSGVLYTSTDGIAWTARSGPTLSGTELPTALAYGADAGGVPSWVVTTYDTATTKINTYRSYDNGITFPGFANTLPIPAPAPMVGLAAIGSMFVGSFFESGAVRLLYSGDGGATWQTSSGIVFASGFSTIVGGPNQFFAIAALGTFYTPSLTYGSPGGIGAQ